MSAPGRNRPVDPTAETVDLPARPMATPDAHAPRPERTFVPGTLLAGRYVVVRFLASGGMGEVYEVEDHELGGRLALKTVLHASEGANALRREVALARQVTHPNVCRIFDVAYHDDGEGRRVAFFTMELVEGETLAHRLARWGRVSMREALPIVRQLAAGLEAAHSAGVVHRDLKPANIMLAADGRAVIMDFGIARPGAGEGAAVASSATPAYAAPEQLRGGVVTTASDLYALGAVIYEMVTGDRPYGSAQSITEMLRSYATRPPRPAVRAPGLDARWDAAVMRCLEHDPGKRFRSAGDLVAALESSRPAPRWPAALALVTAAFAAVAAAAAWVGGRPQEPLPVITIRVPVANASRPAAEPEPAPEPKPTPAVTVSPAAPAPPATARAAGRFRLSLDTTPWTRVFLGKKKLGETPLLEVPLPSGPQTLRLVNEALGVDTTIEIEGRPGEHVTKNLSL